jgi:glycerol-3-phosphate cytidylyltransferase
VSFGRPLGLPCRSWVTGRNTHIEQMWSTCLASAPGAFDLFHIGHLNLLREARSRCDFLIAGVVADNQLVAHKAICPIIPVSERLEIVRNIRCVDLALPATTTDKVEIWRRLRFDILFKGDDWRGTEKGSRLERDLAAVGVEIVYVPYTKATSSSALRRVLQNIDAMAAGRVLASNEAPAQIQAGGRRLLEGTPGRPHPTCMSALGPQANLFAESGWRRRLSGPDNCRSQSDLKARAGVPLAHVCIIMAAPNRLGNELT